MKARSAKRSRPLLVVGHDGSAASRAALSLAARRAGHGRALLDSVLLTANDELIDTDYDTELIEGPTAKAIADVARAEHADAIFVGSRGLGSIRALLGSVSHELLHIAEQPVVVVPAASARR